MIQVNRIYLIFNRLVTKKFLVDTSDYLLELALVSKANYLITGDKDLLSMGEIGCCQIITVMEFDALISSSGYSSFVHENFEDYYHLVVGE